MNKGDVVLNFPSNLPACQNCVIQMYCFIWTNSNCVWLPTFYDNYLV